MTVAVARDATTSDHALMTDYIDHCRALQASDRSLRDRLRLARAFLEIHPDLDAWMQRPVAARLADLRRIPAWPLVTYAILSGRVRVDFDLLAAKELSSFSRSARVLWAGDLAMSKETAEHLGWSAHWTRSIVDQFLPAVLAWTRKSMRDLIDEDLAAFEEALAATPAASATTRRAWRSRLFGLRQLLFECRILTHPPDRGLPATSLAERLSIVPAAEIRRTMLRYVEARRSVLSRSSIDGMANSLIVFGEFLGAEFPDVRSLRQLERRHIETFLTFNSTRPWRGRVARAQKVSGAAVHSTVLALRNFLDDLTMWGWAERPGRRLLFASDVPRLPRPLPRALAPDVDAALMSAFSKLDDLFARCGLTLLRGAGLRLGELLDLELCCVVDYGATGIWLRVPLGKLATERSVPLDATTLGALDDWVAQRGSQRAISHPRDGKLTDFLFMERGRQLTGWRLRKGIQAAVARAGLTGVDGAPMRVTPHQLRHTYATELANNGMSLQALMALLGHVTPEMTLRYATLASPTLRSAYDEAMGKVRRRITLPLASPPSAPVRVEWLRSEFLKTRLAGGFCSRHLTAEACPYANVCETCDNFMPTPDFAPVLEDQLADIRELKADADTRGWASESDRHGRVIASLEEHLTRLHADQAT